MDNTSRKVSVGHRIRHRIVAMMITWILLFALLAILTGLYRILNEIAGQINLLIDLYIRPSQFLSGVALTLLVVAFIWFLAKVSEAFDN